MIVFWIFTVYLKTLKLKIVSGNLFNKFLDLNYCNVQDFGSFELSLM